MTAKRPGPFTNPTALVEALLGVLSEYQRPTSASAASMQPTAAATARAYDIRGIVPEAETESENIELPALIADPSEEELVAYANAHPTVKRALKIFRGRIVKVEKNPG